MTELRFRSANAPTAGGTLRLRIPEQSTGIPMLLLHGGPGGTDYLSKFLGEQICQAGYTPVGGIQRGSPGSTSDGQYTVERFVEDVEDIRKFLGVPKLAIFGHSWGGFLATCYAAIYPDAVERLILVCPMGIRSGWREEFDRVMFERIPNELKEHYLSLGKQARMERDPQKRYALLFQRAQIHVFSYYAPSNRAGQPGLAHLSMDVHEALQASALEWVERPGWEEGLMQLTCPRYLIVGTEDSIPVSVARDYHELLPNLPIEFLEECGHFPFFEQPAEFRSALQTALTSSVSS